MDTRIDSDGTKLFITNTTYLFITVYNNEQFLDKSCQKNWNHYAGSIYLATPFQMVKVVVL